MKTRHVTLCLLWSCILIASGNAQMNDRKESAENKSDESFFNADGQKGLLVNRHFNESPPGNVQKFLEKARRVEEVSSMTAGTFQENWDLTRKKNTVVKINPT